MDTDVAVQWVKRTLKPYVQQEKLERFVLFADNLTAQVSEEFKHEVSSVKSGVVWFGLSGATDMWQPVDSGVAQTVKILVGQAHRDWLDYDTNADRWFANENLFTAAERRILITQWVGQAWEKFSTDLKYENTR